MDLLPRRFAALGFSLLTASLAIARADSQPIEIAAILSMTGPYAEVGIMEARAIDTQVKVANEHGGINGRPLTFHLFDDQSNTGRAYLLADQVVQAKLASVIIGGSTTPTCEAVHLATGPNHVVQYCLSGGSVSGPTYFSSFAAPQRIFGDLPAAFFAERRLQRVTMIVPENHAGKIYESALRTAVAANGLDLVLTAHVTSTADAAEATDRALSDRADVIYVGGDTDIESATLAQVRKRHKKTTVWLVDSASGTQMARSFATVLPKGPIYTAGDAISMSTKLPETNPQRESLMAFWKTFTHYENVRPNKYAVIAADATSFVIQGLRNNGGLGGLPLAQAIETLPPTMGLYSTYQFSAQRHDGAGLAGIIVRLHSDSTMEYVETLHPKESIPVSAAVAPEEVPAAMQPRATTAPEQQPESYPNDNVAPSALAPVEETSPAPVSAPAATMPAEQQPTYGNDTAPATDSAGTPAQSEQPTYSNDSAQPDPMPAQPSTTELTAPAADTAAPAPAPTVMPVDTE